MIVLGPILGIESDNTYTALIVLKGNVDSSEFALTLEVSGETQTVRPQNSERLVHHTAIRFAFNVQPADENSETSYSLQRNSAHLYDKFGNSNWKFVIPGKNAVPKIGFASCNGDSSKAPGKYPADAYVMWEKLFEEHNRQELYHSFHLMLLNGDQIYADHIWDTVEYFSDNQLMGWFSTLKFIDHKIDEAEKPALRRRIEEFYENLYIESWGVEAISKVLSAIPSAMIWDDHDIFDGWGSHPTDLQDCDLFKLIFEVAKQYFEIFQIRTRDNQTLLSDLDYSQRLSFRNFEIITLDNRSHRTLENVMSKEQFANIANLKNEVFFESCPAELSNQKVILFVIPVPIAHLNYKRRSEQFISRLFSTNFRSTLNDDGIDHWDHSTHEGEQSRLIDMIFSFGDHFDPRYVHIVSGDVHSCGAGKIERTRRSRRRVNQFVSSAIVHKPAGKFGQLVVDWASTEISKIPGYEISLDELGKGSSRPLTIYERNFGFLYKPKKGGLRYYLTLEHSTNNYEWDQPGVFNPDS